ncbi:thermonuclease family protein, partial [Leptospira sp. SA-E8]|uniref:thermonuclease family protein n=1 Tax=Leptospira sp. SA-E8 TaxID=3422259 RepID=UPI003EBC429A
GAPSSWLAEVVAVLDGDTIDVVDMQKHRQRIRLQGIDAPEVAHVQRRSGKTCQALGQPHADQARQALAGKVQGQLVRIRTNGESSYERVVGYVVLGKRDINLEMVAEGWAWSIAKRHDASRVQHAYARAQRKAQAEHRGLWDEAEPVHPAKWRMEKAGC